MTWDMHVIYDVIYYGMGEKEDQCHIEMHLPRNTMKYGTDSSTTSTTVLLLRKILILVRNYKTRPTTYVNKTYID